MCPVVIWRYTREDVLPIFNSALVSNLKLAILIKSEAMAPISQTEQARSIGLPNTVTVKVKDLNDESGE